MLAIIGGSGLTRLSTLAVAHREVVRTPYGEPSSALLFGQIAGRDAVFLARHGHGHTIPPHRVNYRANLWALQERGATRGRRGRLGRRHRAAAAPGDLVLPHQLIDYTSGRDIDVLRRRRPATSCTSTSRIRTRRDCARAASRAARAGGHRARRRRRLRRGATGRGSRPRPRSTAWSATAPTLVGMTGMPEAALARELGPALRGDLRRRQPRRRPRRQRAGRSSMDGIDARARSGDGQGAHAARPRRAAGRTADGR